jgi:hypothetical protein
LSQDDKTPVEKQDPFELILAAVQRTETEARATKTFAQQTHDVSLAWYEEHKQLQSKVLGIERERWFPTLISVAAALVSLACAYAASR